MNALHVKANDNYTDQFGKKRSVPRMTCVWEGGCSAWLCAAVLGCAGRLEMSG